MNQWNVIVYLNQNFIYSAIFLCHFIDTSKRHEKFTSFDSSMQTQRHELCLCFQRNSIMEDSTNKEEEEKNRSHHVKSNMVMIWKASDDCQAIQHVQVNVVKNLWLSCSFHLIGRKKQRERNRVSKRKIREKIPFDFRVKWSIYNCEKLVFNVSKHRLYSWENWAVT